MEYKFNESVLIEGEVYGKSSLSGDYIVGIRQDSGGLYDVLVPESAIHPRTDAAPDALRAACEMALGYLASPRLNCFTEVARTITALRAALAATEPEPAPKAEAPIEGVRVGDRVRLTRTFIVKGVDNGRAAITGEDYDLLFSYENASDLVVIARPQPPKTCGACRWRHVEPDGASSCRIHLCEVAVTSPACVKHFEQYPPQG